MVVTEDVWLPSDEELKHKEIPVTTNIMRASAMHLGKYCDDQSKEFMLCRTEERDPRKCLAYGQAVTECGLDFYRKVKKTCRAELEFYTKCLTWTSQHDGYSYCRREQAVYDKCMDDNGFERAPFGHFQLVRVHNSERPEPKPNVPLFPDATPGYDFQNNPVRESPQGLKGESMMNSSFDH